MSSGLYLNTTRNAVQATLGNTESSRNIMSQRIVYKTKRAEGSCLSSAYWSAVDVGWQPTSYSKCSHKERTADSITKLLGEAITACVRYEDHSEHQS
eukprot:9311-Heterococcus_DN1.PRE.2